MGEKWMDRLDLPDEPMPAQTLAEIVGNSRVLIEHHNGVTQYGSSMICVKVKFGNICVLGQNLRLVQMTTQQLIISGCIDCVKLERVGK